MHVWAMPERRVDNLREHDPLAKVDARTVLQAGQLRTPCLTRKASVVVGRVGS